MNDAEDSVPTKGAKVQSAEVGTQILKALADLAPSTSLKRLGEYLDMPAAKVHRYLQALIASGFAEQDPLTNHYGLGREALYVGLAAIRRLDVVRSPARRWPICATRWGRPASSPSGAVTGPPWCRSSRPRAWSRWSRR